MIKDVYEKDLNHLDEEDVRQIKDIIAFAKIGKKSDMKYCKKQSFVIENGNLIACDFLGLAWFGRFNIKKDMGETATPYQWAILLYKNPHNNRYEPNSFARYIEHLSDTSGYESTLEFLQSIVDEYEPPKTKQSGYKHMKDMYNWADKIQEYYIRINDYDNEDFRTFKKISLELDYLKHKINEINKEKDNE
jgi:hypothetical protein